MKKLLVVAAVTSSGFLLPGLAQAEPPPDPGDFGHHVAHCAHEHGFNAEHNPGMHRGRTGWDGAAC